MKFKMAINSGKNLFCHELWSNNQLPLFSWNFQPFDLLYPRVTIYYKHVGDTMQRSFAKDCPITEDNVSVEGENGSLFKKSVGYFAAYKNAIQRLESNAMLESFTPGGDGPKETHTKIVKLSIEGHILSNRTAFIGVQKIDTQKQEPESTSEVKNLPKI